MYFKKKLKMTEVEQVIKYAKMLNSKNLSALRSGNISLRVKENGVETMNNSFDNNISESKEEI